MARRALGPATLIAVQAVERVLSAGDQDLVVACSGGADSLALAVASAEVGRRCRLPVSSVVVDHGLQSDSQRVAAQVQGILAGLGVPAEVVRATRTATRDGPEATARAARYAVLEQRAAERGSTVLLGHTLDDQAETVLLGLARGSGTRSLSGMAVRRGRLLRPFLGLRRATTAAACAEAGLTPWSDPHNVDPAFTRVRIRDRVLPVLEAELGPGVAEALARTAFLAREDADLLDQLAAEQASEQAAGPELACEVLAALPPPIRRRVLRDWLRGEGVTDLGSAHLDAVAELVTDWHGQRGIDVPGATVRRVADRLIARPPVRG